MRDKRIDCFKGILTVQMVLAHCLQFYANFDVDKGWWFLTEYINLTTFSGFVFAYGYISDHAYFQGEFISAIRRIGKNMIRLIIAFYISSFAFAIFIESMPFRADKVFEIVFVKRLAGWSEFLFSFAGVMLVTIALWKAFHSRKDLWLLLIALCSVAVCLLPHREVTPIVGTFLGGYGGTYFPVIPYYLYFVIGVYFAKKEMKFHWIALLISIAGTAYAVLYAIFFSKGWPPRFPLSFAWLIGSMLFLYAYYLLSLILGNSKYFAWLADIGRYSLTYLLISNIIIFALKQSRFFIISSDYSVGLFAVIMFILWYMIGLVKGRSHLKANGTLITTK